MVVVLEAEVVSLQQVELLAHLLEQQPPARLRLKILHISSRNTLGLAVDRGHEFVMHLHRNLIMLVYLWKLSNFIYKAKAKRAYLESK